MKLISKKRSGQKGLTLIELLIVIVLLGVLSTLVAGNLMTSLKRGRDARRKGDLNGIAKALEVYNADFGSYPLAQDGVIYGCSTVVGATHGACDWGGEFSVMAPGNNKVIYMAKLPKDPSGEEYIYESNGGADYGLFIRLENPDDPENITNNADCGTEKCNYGITSTNTTIENLVGTYVPEL